MKLPSIIKTPGHKRFYFEPRHYDPIKEEIKERTERIRRQLEAKEEDGYFASNISESFAKNSRRNKRSNAVQLFFILFFILFAFGYIYYGNIVLYSFLVVLPLYILIRIKKNL